MVTNSTNTRLRASDAQKRDFSDRLLRRLAEIGMNQSDLARKIGVTKDAVSTYARQRSLPAPDTLKKIAVAVGLKPDDLLPARYEHEEPLPITIELRGDGKCRIICDIELPQQVGLEIISKLQPYASSHPKRGR
jgi:transcriptional regulator with XRE-family HTH domain